MSGKNHTSNLHNQFSSQNLFNRSNKLPGSMITTGYFMSGSKPTPFNTNNSNIHYNNVNYSNFQYRPTAGQNSFSIEPFQSRKLKENINNRSISQMNNMNINSIMNFQSEEKYILDHVEKLLADQNGCRILQKKLDEKNKDFMYLFYEKIKDKVSSIINNQFGNYLMQKFIESCLLVDVNYLIHMLNNIKPQMLDHANDPYGSRVVQKLLDILNSGNSAKYSSSQSLGTTGNQQIPQLHQNIADLLIEFAKNSVLSLIIDTNGNHVLQKILILSKKFHSMIVLEEIIKNIIDIAKLKQGASVIQKALECGSDTHKVRSS